MDGQTGNVEPQFLMQAKSAVDALCAASLSLVTAESCTGGLVAAAISQAPRAGECLQGGFVVYSKDSKIQSLDVDPALLERDGSVSAAVAVQMAQGALRHSNADVAVAITGVLGPGPDEDGHPAGQIFFACCRRDRPPRVVEHPPAEEHPDELRRSAVLQALQMLRDCAASGTRPPR